MGEEKEDKSGWLQQITRRWRILLAVAFFITAIAIGVSGIEWTESNRTNAIIAVQRILVIGVFLALAVIAIALTKVPYNENQAYDRLGKLVVLEPGLHLIFPVIHKYVDKTQVADMQDGIQLFSKETWLNCAGGGRVNFGDNLWIWFMYVEEGAPKTCFLKARDHRERIKKEAEDAIRDTINNTSLDTLIPIEIEKRKSAEEVQDLLFSAVKKDEKLKSLIKHLGGKIEINSVTLGDYDIDEQSEAKRRERYESSVDVGIAAKKAEASKQEIGDALVGIRGKMEKGGFSKNVLDEGAIDTFRDRQAGSKLNRSTVNWHSKGENGSSSVAGLGPELIAKLKHAFGLELFGGAKKGEGEKGEGEKGEEKEREGESVEEMRKKVRKILE